MNVRLLGPIETISPDRWQYEFRLIEDPSGRVLERATIELQVFDSAQAGQNPVTTGDVLLKTLRERLLDLAMQQGYTILED